MAPKDDLPLKYQTPPEWGPVVLREPLALLNDHAHLERKAATNALELLLRWPTPNPPENWVHAMTSISVDEASHLNTVSRLLARRGGALSRTHRNPYAAELRRLVRIGKGNHELVDRLLISALIEARSCERFFLLSETSGDQELSRLYEGLYRSEAGHFRVFLALARDLPEKLAVESRWEEMLEAEADIITRQPAGPTMHSGMP